MTILVRYPARSAERHGHYSLRRSLAAISLPALEGVGVLRRHQHEICGETPPVGSCQQLLPHGGTKLAAEARVINAEPWEPQPGMGKRACPADRTAGPCPRRLLALKTKRDLQDDDKVVSHLGCSRGGTAAAHIVLRIHPAPAGRETGRASGPPAGDAAARVYH